MQATWGIAVGCPRCTPPVRACLARRLFPGLGHLAAGRRRRAALFGLPVLAFILLGARHRRDDEPPRLAATLFDPAVLWGLLALQLGFLVWRLLAVGSSLFGTPAAAARPSRGDPDRRDPAARCRGTAGVCRIHDRGRPGDRRRDLRGAVAQRTGRPVASAEPDPSFLAPASPSASASASPSPSPTPLVPRVNVLIVGVDAGVGRNTYLTDTMIVASLDPVDETVSMVSIPRDMVDVPLPDGRKFRGKINGLVSYARHHPKQFPGSDGDGLRRPRGRPRELLGLEDHYYARSTSGLRQRRQQARRGQRRRRATASATRPTTSTASRTASRSPRASPPQRQRRPSRTLGFGRPPARATSPARPASRRSSRASATGRRRRLPQRPDRPDPGARPDHHDEHAPQARAGPCRRDGQDRARRTRTGR